MTQDLLEQLQAHQPIIETQAFTGAILGLQGDVLQGWAMDMTQPEQRPAVEVLIDGSSVALVRADQYEPQAPMGDEFHGFTVQLRRSWLDHARVISARIANRDIALDGNIMLPTASTAQASVITSQVWHTGGLRVAGWAWDPQVPSRHVEVFVHEGDQFIQRVICDTHHQALAYRATSNHGFEIDLPWDMADGKVHILNVVNDLGQPLAGSPIRLCCWPEGIEGLARTLSSTHEAATLALLSQIAKEQSLYLPKSAGWHVYPTWFDKFQRFEDPETPISQRKLGVLIISEGNTALTETSIASLHCDLAIIHLSKVTSSSNLLEALKELLNAGCDQIVPLAEGDRFAPLALHYLSAMLNDGGAWGYADCDRDGPNGERSLPWLKPAWDVDLFIGADIFTPGAIFSAEIIEQALTLLGEHTKQRAIDWHLLIAGVVLATLNTAGKVVHLPRVLYHRGKNSPASPEEAIPSPERADAIRWLCEKISPGASLEQVSGYGALLKVTWPLPERLPRVSLIVPTRDQYKLLKACIEGLLNETDYPNLEIIVVDNQSSDPDTLSYLHELSKRGVIILKHPYPFNYSTINNRAATIATGEVIGLVNNDIEIIDRRWLKEMLGQLLQTRVGAVGAKLLWPNHMVQHGGVVVGVNGLAAHTGNNLTDQDAGYLGTNQLTRQQSAVTAACLLVRKSVFEEVGGLDEQAFPVAFNDVDFCLRIRKRGYKIIWSPFAKLIHAESASRGKDVSPEKRSRAQREQNKFIEKWALADEVDPFYHPSMSHDFLSGPYGGLSLPPRCMKKARTN